MNTGPPSTEAELLARAQELAGRRLADIATTLGVATPANSTRAKGFAGTLLERALGATAASRPVPDFELIGVEMKTLPIDANGRPRESTYVCTVPLADNHDTSWENSVVRHKLSRVLWVPVLTSDHTAVEDRVVGTALIWSPSGEQRHALRRDYEELMDMVVLGRLAELSAHHGTWLQIRPKAADGHARGPATGAGGEPVSALPRGFYLRARFTSAILQQHYAIP